MKKDEPVIVSRRKLVTGLASVGGLVLAGCSSKELPPTYGNVLRTGDLLTYRAFRVLLPSQSLVREYSRTRYDFESCCWYVEPRRSAPRTLQR